MNAWYRMEYEKINECFISCNISFKHGDNCICGFGNEFGDNCSVTQLSPNSYLMASKNEKDIMVVEETKTDATVRIEGQGNSEAEGYFYFDKVNGTIYSSYTGNTISVSDISSNSSAVITRATGDVVKRDPKKISYAKIADIVTPTSSNIAIAGAIIITAAALGGVEIATTAGVIVAWLGTEVWDVIRKGIVNRSTRHGVKVVIATVEIQHHQGGGMVTGYRYNIEDVCTY